VRRIVSSAMAVTTRRAISLSASHGIVPHGRASGGVLQAKALRKAACVPAS
jgi:hypothetical protein